ncbi:MAG: LptF/LptG family permease [Phycisphaerales bacterium]
MAWEIVRVLAITTGVIVTVIAFGAAAKPLAENQIGAETILKYVSLAMVPMLQFALPFAAGFAATLVMHRLATDNEVVAMAASGMSYRRIFAPVLGLGLILAVAMFVLVAFIAPLFWTRMKEMVTADATQVLVAAVRRGEAAMAGKMMIYADAVEEVQAPPETGADRRLLLTGLAAVELARGGAAPATEFTAERAAVDIYATDAGTIAKLVLANATVFRAGEGAIATVPRVEPEAAALGSGFDRSPKFLPLRDLIALRDDVDLADEVRRAKRPLAALAAEAQLWRCAESQLGGAGASLLLEELGTRRSFRIEGARLAAGDLLPVAGRTTFALTELVDGRPYRTAVAERALLRSVSEAGFEARLALVVPEPQKVRDLAAGLPGRWPPRVDDLRPSGCASQDWAHAGSQQLIEEAGRIPQADGAAPWSAMGRRAEKASKDLVRRRADVRFETDSHIAQRAAQSVSVVLVLLLGATLAVAMRRALPLTIYLLAFLPSIANILMIAGGQQTMRDGYVGLGSAIMWGGNLVLLAAVAASWMRLRRT